MNFKLKIIVSCFLVLSACAFDPLDIKPTNKNLAINFINLDSIISLENKVQVVENLKQKAKNSEEIINYQLGFCLGIGSLYDTSTINRLILFANDPYIIRLEKSIKRKFINLSLIKNNVLNGFLYLNYHFEKCKLPKNIFFINSFFASNVFVGENDIAIGLERYLGVKEGVIKELPVNEFHTWIKEKMLKEYLERDVLFTWIMTHLVKEENENFASQMIRWGKILYFTEASFPDAKKNLILRYTKKQFDWCEKNEISIWKYLVEYKLLFSKNERDYSNFFNDAPFTSGLDKESPDRVGQYIGWKIVHSYMKKYPETQLRKLLNISYINILQNYKQ